MVTSAAEAAGRFTEEGFLGPVPILAADECGRFLDAALSGGAPLDWAKGHVPISPAFWRLASSPRIVEVVRELLGPNLLVWGGSILEKAPEVVHPWHTDIESSTPDGQTVSVWIGLRHTTLDSSLALVSKSHRFGVNLQQERARFGKDRASVTNELVEEWAKARDGTSELVQLPMRDGEALFFDGRVWHASHNTSGQTRYAVLLQYATADTPIRIPDLTQLDWPFRLLDEPRPPCVTISGSDRSDVNRVVPPPEAAPDNQTPGDRLDNVVYPLHLPLPLEPGADWQPFHIFRGSTPNIAGIGCHVSALAPGRSPHPPHHHPEEELLLLLRGSVDLVLPDAADPDCRHTRLQPGEFVYYPGGFAHTLQNCGDAPANYLMFKWHGEPTRAPAPLPFDRFRPFAQPAADEVASGWRAHVLFERPTRFLSKLHCHVSELAVGGGYEPHVDEHDVAIILFEGEVETIGHRVESHAVIFHAAGQTHGIRNVGAVPARYLVFEFHGIHRHPPQ